MRLRHAIPAALLLAMVAPWWATPASAQGGPIDIQQFKPAMDSKGHFSVDSTQILSPWKTSFGLIVNYANKPLVLKGADGRYFITDHLVGANIQFAIGMFRLSKTGMPWLQIGLGIPVGFQQSRINNDPFTLDAGDPLCSGSDTGAGCTVWSQDPTAKDRYPMGYDSRGNVSAQGIGDMYLHLKFRFVNAYIKPLGLGALLTVTLPSSAWAGDSHNKMLGSGGWGIAPKFIMDKVWKKQGMLLSFNVGMRFRFGTKGELKENSGWSNCSWAALPIAGGTYPCSDTDDSYGFSDKEPDNGLSYRVRWLYELTYGLGLSWRLAPSVEWVNELFGAVELSTFGAKDEAVSGSGDLFSSLGYEGKYYRRVFPLEFMSGFKFYLAASSYFAVAAGVGLTGVGPLDNVGAPDVRVIASFVFEPSVGDRDGDGIPDDVDQCPDDPEDFDGFEDEDGCPDPDNDGDGICDDNPVIQANLDKYKDICTGQDKCPNEPENFNGFEDEDGCPDQKEEDRDGDGIPDHLDKCPDEPEDKDGFEDEDGCPDEDNDGDGVPDKTDRCPGHDADKANDFVNTKEDMDGFEDEDGCPDPDNDGDGIPDYLDKCPDEPENKNGYQDQDGCPDKAPVAITKDRILIMEKIYFETNKDIIKPVSYGILDTVASTLNSHKEIRKIEIQGHTDERGSRAHNLNLSQRRSNAVRNYLINKGVSPDRLTARGYGPDRPLCRQSTTECWSRNRRSEFVIVSRN